MGKIRIKKLGSEEQEEKQRKSDVHRRLVKKEKKDTPQKIKAPGGTSPKAMPTARGKGGERVKAVASPTESDLLAEIEKEHKKGAKEGKKQAATERPELKITPKTQKSLTPKPPRQHSKRYQELKKQVDRTKTYPVSEAVGLIKQTSKIGFTGSIEAHAVLRRKAKELGLKNPKNAKDPKNPNLPNFPKIMYEAKFPLAHAVLGKADEDDKTIQDNLASLIKTIGNQNIVKLTLSSTMGPGIKVEV